MARKTISKASASIFDYQDWVEKLASEPTILDRLLGIVDFEKFRPVLREPLMREAKGPGGRPAFDEVLIFKILILQRLYHLSDDQAEFQIKDRFSFQRFLGLSVADAMPDAKTIWKYRNQWAQAGTIDVCFAEFKHQLADYGVSENPGKMVDATFVDVPKQRNTREENAHIKEHGTAPEAWSGDEPKCRQKDVDARWTKKNQETHYGYKCHTLVSTMTKIIEGYRVTGANVHDSQMFIQLLDSERDIMVYADSAYSSQKIEGELQKMGIDSMICKKGTRARPLNEEEQRWNKEVSRIRCRIEHVFGTMTSSMDAMTLRCVGIVRATACIGLNNLTYNMLRLEQIVRLKLRIA